MSVICLAWPTKLIYRHYVSKCVCTTTPALPSGRTTLSTDKKNEHSVIIPKKKRLISKGILNWTSAALHSTIPLTFVLGWINKLEVYQLIHYIDYACMAHSSYFPIMFYRSKINTKADQFQSDHSTRQTYSVHCFKRQLLWPFKFIQVLSAFSDSIPFRYPSFELDVKRYISILPENIFSCGHLMHLLVLVWINC